MEPQDTESILPAHLPSPKEHPFEALVISAMYAGSERGLQADILAARGLGGAVTTVSTALVMASQGTVTDIVDVPSDAVRAQLEHVSATTDPDAIKIGIAPHPHTIQTIFDHLAGTNQPVLLDATASGPCGETLLARQAMEVLIDHLDRPNLITIRRQDAELMMQMEINSLDDAQVAVQRLEKRGARQVLLRCGRIKREFHASDESAPPFAVDLFYDGEEFGLFEAPYLEGVSNVNGASSALTMALLSGLSQEQPVVEALQKAKIYVTQALRFAKPIGAVKRPNYFWLSTVSSDNASNE